jgi:hypothetical protein
MREGRTTENSDHKVRAPRRASSLPEEQQGLVEEALFSGRDREMMK